MEPQGSRSLALIRLAQIRLAQIRRPDAGRHDGHARSHRRHAGSHTGTTVDCTYTLKADTHSAVRASSCTSDGVGPPCHLTEPEEHGGDGAPLDYERGLTVDNYGDLAITHDGSAHDGSAHDGSAHDRSAHDGSRSISPASASASPSRRSASGSVSSNKGGRTYPPGCASSRIAAFSCAVGEANFPL